MYSRYISPEKEPRRVPLNPEPFVSHPVPSSSSATPYARYIPPARPAAEPVAPKRKIIFDYDDEPEVDLVSKKRAKRETPDVEAAKASARGEELTQEKARTEDIGSRKHKREETASKDKDGGTSFDQSRAAALDRPTRAHAETEPKQKRDMSRHVDGDAQVDRHKAVLEKKEKALARVKKALDSTEQGTAEPSADAEEEVEEHGLQPLPQPEPIPVDKSKPSYETLPPWLADPIRVSSETKAPFSSLGIDPEHGIPAQAEKILKEKGWKEAFAVQTAVIPLLLPSPGRKGDLVVSAATGSGKTLAYVLPMIRDLSRGMTTRLRGLIVVPTRELVQQAKEVCDACAMAYASSNRKRVKIGVAMGSQSFEKEQASIMEQYQKYDPSAYSEYRRKRAQWPFVGGLDSAPETQPATSGRKPLPDHIIEHISRVDILITTPGRLVEHLQSTPGFTLDFVRWLVIDEADKLLGQSFQQWLDIVMDRLGSQPSELRDFADSNQSGVRKVVLSATMTKDLSLLSSLRLRRPKHIVLEGTSAEEAGDFFLPELLLEFGVKIREESQKPLYLVELLNSKHIAGIRKALRDSAAATEETDETSSESTDTETTSTSSESDDDSDTSSSSSQSDTETEKGSKPVPPSKSSKIHFDTTVLIFTKSNESALRLSRLVGILAPHTNALVGTLTSTVRTSERRKILRAFNTGKLRILIASDIASRGLDLPHLDHVVNYDMPTSVASYVHRVGRTARAGRPGKAWTLFTKKEAGWFWPEVAGQGQGRGSGGTVRRANKVEQIRIGGGDDEAESGGRFSEKRVAEYEAALEQLGQEAVEGRRKRRTVAV